MGLVRSLEWVNSYSKKQCRSLFWRLRAAVKKAMKNGGKQQLKFQYDPSSYALNFDDGCCHLSGGYRVKCGDTQSGKNTMWIYVLWVES